MTPRMTVVFVKHTGHVLAALTRTAAADAAMSAADVAGPGLLVRSAGASDADLEVPAEELDVVVTDLRPEVLLEPRAYRVLKNGEPQLDALSSLPGVTVTTTTTDVTVTLVPPPSSEVAVWVLLRKVASGETAVVTGEVTPPGATESMPHPLGAGQLRLLTLVSGVTPALSTSP